MPQMEGFEVLKRLRMDSDIPVLMLTVRGEDTDRIVRLEMGADEYPPRPSSSPFVFLELHHRFDHLAKLSVLLFLLQKRHFMKGGLPDKFHVALVACIGNIA